MASGGFGAKTATRGYVLQRFMNACAGRGAYPIKFNGSLFNFDMADQEFGPGYPYDADYRRWGGPYWFQNTRLIYWPMLACGDFDLMRPLFRMYRDALPLARARTLIYFGHEGAFFPETMYFWGAYAHSNYGWDRTGKHVSHVDSPYIRYYWSGALELLAMGLDYYAYTGDRPFLASSLLPLADAILQFYDLHYGRDERGKFLFVPAAALETWHAAVNPLPEIVGLAFVLDGLLALPRELTDAGRRAAWQRQREEVPLLPLRQEDGETLLAAAQELLGPIKNSENPELYAIFPYRLYGVGKPDLELARRTFERRRVKGTGGWRQDAIQAAFLGLAGVARDYVAQNFSSVCEGARFPAFWGPNFDWVPDQDHGSVAMMALQAMLMQCQERRIVLFPAWPKEWDVEFKLAAPLDTVVQGVYRGGNLMELDVGPEARRSDVTVLEPQ